MAVAGVGSNQTPVVDLQLVWHSLHAQLFTDVLLFFSARKVA